MSLIEGFDVLPAETEPPDPDDALTLEDAIAAGDQLAISQEPPVTLGRAPAMDVAQRRFVPNTAGGPLMVYGIATLAQWIEKCLRTRRGANPAVDPEFGLDLLLEDLVDGGPFDAAAAAEYEATVERALLTHPAIEAIEEWTVEYEAGDDDFAAATFRVIPSVDGEDPLDMNVTLLGD